MDPDANLSSIRILSESILEKCDSDTVIPPDDAIRLAELVQALDDWICKGGFLPHNWAVVAVQTKGGKI